MNTVDTTIAASTLPERVSGLPLFPGAFSPEDWAELPIGRGPSRKELSRGYGLGRKVHSLDLAANPNTVVIGPCGTGKSVLLRQIAATSVTRGHDVHVIDPIKGGLDFGNFRLWLGSVAEDYPAAASTMESLVDDASRRVRLLAVHNVGRWSDLPADVLASEGIRPITVIIDEYAALSRTTPVPRSTDGLDRAYLREIQERNGAVARIMASTRTLLQRARYAGVHVVVGAQRVEHPAFPGGLEHFDSVVYMLRENNNPEGMSMAFRGKASAEDVEAAVDGIGDGLLLKGAAVMVDASGAVTPFRVAYETPEQLADGLRALLGNDSAGSVGSQD